METEKLKCQTQNVNGSNYKMLDGSKHYHIDDCGFHKFTFEFF